MELIIGLAIRALARPRRADDRDGGLASAVR